MATTNTGTTRVTKGEDITALTADRPQGAPRRPPGQTRPRGTERRASFLWPRLRPTDAAVGIWHVVKIAIMSILCALVAGCALEPPPLRGDLHSAREACNREYPRRVGNYLPHAQCVNAAVERYALPTASHPD